MLRPRFPAQAMVADSCVGMANPRTNSPERLILTTKQAVPATVCDGQTDPSTVYYLLPTPYFARGFIRLEALFALCVLLLVVSALPHIAGAIGPGAVQFGRLPSKLAGKATHTVTVSDAKSFNHRAQAEQIACPGSFIVNSLTDTDDAAPGDGLCDDGSGNCTLRAAIEEANALPTCGAIAFDLTGLSGQINLNTELPAINHDVNINCPAADVLAVRRAVAPLFRVLTVNNGVTATVSGLTITNGKLDSTVSADQGGAILNNGSLTLNALTISNSIVTGDVTNQGGAIFNSGTLLLMNSTITGNKASGNGSGLGGGIFNSGILTMMNNTLTANAANGHQVDEGGAIYNSSSGTLKMVNCTINKNTASGGTTNFGGGIFNEASGTVFSRNTIIAGNSSPNSPDFNGALTSQGHNFISITTGMTVAPQPGDQLDVAVAALKLGGIASNGGPTKTMKLSAGSVAIDAGDDCVTTDTACSDPLLTTDQRGPGFARLLDAHVDIGAVEFSPSPLGNYPDTSITISADATVTPDAVPTNTNSLNVQLRQLSKGRSRPIRPLELCTLPMPTRRVATQ